ncbi:MAG: hypothetical protein SGJ09_04370, partial [Phycisphaerae bacterium]|nr:hypothetical protein [Phycisphaerae bacterium]
ANTNLTFQVAVSDGSNTTYDTVTITVNADDDAPSDLTVSVDGVAGDAAVGLVVGTVTAVDIDSSFHFELNGARGAFAIDPSTGVITVADADALRAIAGEEVSVRVRVIDDGGNVTEREVSVAVDAIAPVPSDVDNDHASTLTPRTIALQDATLTRASFDAPSSAAGNSHNAPAAVPTVIVSYDEELYAGELPFDASEPRTGVENIAIPLPVPSDGPWASVTQLTSSDEGPRGDAFGGKDFHGEGFDDAFEAVANEMRLEIDQLAHTAAQTAAPNADLVESATKSASVLAAFFGFVRSWTSDREDRGSRDMRDKSARDD